MYCVKTGARLYIEELGAVVSADIYAVGEEGLVARWNPHPEDYADRFITVDKALSAGATHMAMRGPWPQEDWLRADIGVLVTQRYLLTGELC